MNNAFLTLQARLQDNNKIAIRQHNFSFFEACPKWQEIGNQVNHNKRFVSGTTLVLLHVSALKHRQLPQTKRLWSILEEVKETRFLRTLFLPKYKVTTKTLVFQHSINVRYCALYKRIQHCIYSLLHIMFFGQPCIVRTKGICNKKYLL